MRYYDFAVNASSEMIREKTRVKLNDYCFDSVIGAVNMYLYRKMNNDCCFIAYREEGDRKLHAVFSHDETTCSFSDAYGEIMDRLGEGFCINKVLSEPEEITIRQFMDNIQEAKRREYMNYWSRIIDSAKLWIHDYDNFRSDERRTHFTFSERIIPTEIRKPHGLLAPEFVSELENIESHKGDPAIRGNVVHYILSAESFAAGLDMAEMLAQRLLAAGRISSRRMEIISELSPDCYKSNVRWLENVMENDHGGIVLFDLTERFGCNSVDYQLACEYLEKLVKTYRNDCLFMFFYHTDEPGFSYYLLPNLKKYVIPVGLHEGAGNRQEAVKYLKELIRVSDSAPYVSQAGEFMKDHPGNEFTQSEVMNAFENFGPWSMNRNVFSKHPYAISGDFMLDRSCASEDPYEELQKLIGLKTVKEQIDRVIATNLVEKERKKYRGSKYRTGSMHMIFAGDPGTAKTTVAKLFAGIAKEKGILKSGAFVERGGMDLCGYGCVSAIRRAFSAAKGGVLFIDEAYSLEGDLPVSVLIQEMENRRDDVIVILAGYQDRMKDFMKQNEGLKSRIPHIIDFPNYSPDELVEIFRLMLREKGFTATEEAVEEAHSIFEKIVFVEDFGNGRYVRNLLERAIQNQSVRLKAGKTEMSKVPEDKLFRILREDICEQEESIKNRRPEGTAEKELDEMIGLAGAKALLHKAVAAFKLKKKYLDKGITQDRPSMHMVFTGNPGTAKTTVARLFAEIMRDEKILPSGQFVEVGRADLVGLAVGHTARIVKERFREARGGVLFIDEAYSLCDDYQGGFGDEAISTIVQEMENHREDVVVIFAGYSQPMQVFLDRNPGMVSRIAFRVDFDDYSVEELCGITRLMLSRKKLKITDAAMDRLKNNYILASGHEDFGNGRYVRKQLEEAEMNLAERVLAAGLDDPSEDFLMTIEAGDIPGPGIGRSDTKVRLGFTVD